MQVYFSAGLGESNEASYEFGVEKKKKQGGKPEASYGPFYHFPHAIQNLVDWVCGSILDKKL